MQNIKWAPQKLLYYFKISPNLVTLLFVGQLKPNEIELYFVWSLCLFSHNFVERKWCCRQRCRNIKPERCLAIQRHLGPNCKTSFSKNVPLPASFTLFSSFLAINRNKRSIKLLKTGFEFAGINCFVNCITTQPLPCKTIFTRLVFIIR